jgi:hypothetical protein
MVRNLLQQLKNCGTPMRLMQRMNSEGYVELSVAFIRYGADRSRIGYPKFRLEKAHTS